MSRKILQLIGLGLLVSAVISIHFLYKPISKDSSKSAHDMSQMNHQMTMQRYTVQVMPATAISSTTAATLSFKVFDPEGNQIILFNKVYGKLMHLIIVDSSLTYFNHIHPDYKNGVFTVTTQFPKDGEYHLYTDFEPTGEQEQQVANILTVGTPQEKLISDATPDTTMKKRVGEYDVTLSMSDTKDTFQFFIQDAKTSQPSTNLKPYLESFGHLVMINQKTYEYIHVHPINRLLPPDATGGPLVKFVPMTLTGQPIPSGVYRLFAQFNPDNKLMVVDYTIEIK
jgi:hypothetical protein